MSIAVQTPGDGIPYHTLEAEDPRVLRRARDWVRDPVAFCKEAMNFHPHWYQVELLRDDALFISACWSRQIGKSEAVAHKAIHHAFTTPNACVVIIAPGQRQAKLLYKKVVQAIRSSRLIHSSVIGKIKMEEILFSNGSVIVNLPSGDEGVNLRGYTITLLIADEGAYIPDAVFVAVEQGLSSSGGQEIVISTPSGRHNAFYRMFFPEDVGMNFPLEADGSLKNGHFQIDDWSCHHYDYTVGLDVLKPNGRPQLSELHVRRQQRKLPGWRFRSEYLAEFVEDLGSYFRADQIDKLFNSNFGIVHYPPPGLRYYFGIDIAKTRDFTSIAIGGLHTRNPINAIPLKKPHLQIMKMEYWKGHEGATIDESYPKIIALTEQWRPERIFFDKTAIGERPYEELQMNYGLPIEGIQGSQGGKVKMFGTLTHLIGDFPEIEGWKSRIHSYNDGTAIRQFRNLVYELSPVKSGSTGRTRPGEQAKIYASHGHDDIPISVALLCLCISLQVINAPIEIITNQQRIDRDAIVTDLQRGFIRSQSALSSVSGFGNKEDTNRRRYSRKVFW